MKPRQPSRSHAGRRWQFHQAPTRRPGRCGRGSRVCRPNLRRNYRRRIKPMPADALKCKECQTTYPLEARFVCERCFGPLEVSYTPPGAIPPRSSGGSRRGRTRSGATRIPSARGPARSALPTGWTPLVRADRLAERLGLGELYIKNETANPTHSFKDRVVSVALARAIEFGFDTLACAVDGQPRERRRGARRGRRYARLRADPARPRGAEGARHGRLRRADRGRPGQLRRRQPALHRDLGRAAGWGFVNINMRPYYAEGSKTSRSRSSSSSAGSCRTVSWSRSRPARS